MTESPYQPPHGLGQASFHAMGTTITLLAPLGGYSEAARLTRELFEEWEQTLSRFRPTSEVSRLSASDGRYVKLSAHFTKRCLSRWTRRGPRVASSTRRCVSA